ncbi:MAG TPA: diacylglycerol kinase family protein [Methyloceanibacter sp.]|nr:diacylglycerol kinase family protein [Methyloceanibacter sp.]
MRALLVHNPSAGSGQPTREVLLTLLRDAGFSITCSSSDEDEFNAALEEGADIVIIAGGDGTVAKIARHLPNRKTLLTILPMGTANNIARCLNITGEVEALIAGLRGAPEKRLDVGIAIGPWGQRYFLESVGWGALAEAVDHSAPKLSREERIAHGRKTFAAILTEAKPRPVSFVADGEKIAGDFIFVEVLNLGMTGPRVLISPSAEPGDGLLDIVYLTEDRREAMIDWLKSGAANHPPLETRNAQKVTLTWAHGPMRVDDEVYPAPDVPSEIIIEIEPHGLHVCVPATGD